MPHRVGVDRVGVYRVIRERVRVEPAVEGFTDVDDVGGDTAALRCLGLGVRTSNDDAYRYWSVGRERCRDFARSRLDERIWPSRVVSGEEGAR